MLQIIFYMYQMDSQSATVSFKKLISHQKHYSNYSAVVLAAIIITKQCKSCALVF